MTRPKIGVLALVCIAAVAMLHWQVLFLGVEPDTLLVIRPWTMAQLRTALTGNWLFPTVDFYHRPLATWWFAMDFTLFGLNSRALHLTSLALLALTCTLLASWLWMEAGLIAAVASVALYLTHPVLLDSSIAGAQYHFHMVPLVIVAATLRLWSARRGIVQVRHWWPMLVLPMIGFYFKEDTIVVLPAILVLQAVRARRFGDVPWPSRSLIAATVAIAVVLGGVRWWLFPYAETVGGLADRVGIEGLRIAAYAPARTAFGMFAHTELLWGATAFILLLQGAGAWTAWRRPASTAGWAWICGLVMLIACCLPLTLTAEIRSTRVHLAVFSAAIMLGAGSAALLEWARRGGRLWRGAAVVVLIAGVLAQRDAQNRARVERFLPCADEQVSANDYAQHWPEVTPDLRQWLHDMPATCAAGQFPSPEDNLQSVRWSDPTRHVVLVNRRASSVTLTFSPPSTAVTLIIAVDGQRQRLRLTRDSAAVPLALTPTWRTWLRRDFRLDIRDADGGAVPALDSIEVR